ncbi:lysylphosphatidylglycerol synthase domain-containing protein [Isoptericola sp. b490]|uniref:lysylphosphatidylglycerol synthase domain-containing protein n=1 Tax=Actinotalea lenta TaxID=3064654 RepID=UPI00271359EB|nr:lysylphosphatidylglycerol synthase domain-containing protein [Isoptericola sp. b490]MDO8120389.1 lysylphosphatidylglycerol synthase domain-containing protein [Isoptericola sp. b490]
MSGDEIPAEVRSATRPALLRRLVTGVLGVAVLVAMVAFLPRIAGTTWPAVGDLVRGIAPAALLGLGGLWFTTVLAHSVVQTGALPGLGYRRAVALNAGSSAVASSVPVGGPVSVAVNWAMLRSWGFGRSDFSTYTLVTTIVMTAARLAVPLVTAVVLIGAGGLPSVAGPIVTVSAVALVVLGGAMGVLGAPAVRRRLAASAHPGLLGRVARGVDAALEESRAVLVDRWLTLSAAAAVQLVLQYALLVGCLAITGAGVGLTVALVAFAAGRLLSVLPVTPGGLGVTETGVGALLVALGAPAAAAVAAVLLYGLYMVVLEIPIGAGVLAWWRIAARRRRQPSAA